MLNLYSYFEGVDDEVKARGIREKQARENKTFETLFPLMQSNAELGIDTNKLALGKNSLNLQKQQEELANFYSNSDLRAQNQKLLRERAALEQKLGLADVAARNAISDTTIEANARKSANTASGELVSAKSATETMSPLNDPTTRAKVAQMFALNPDEGVNYLRKNGYDVKRTPDGQGVYFNGQPLVGEDFTLFMADPITFAKGRRDAANKMELAKTRSPYTADGTTTSTTPSTVQSRTQAILQPAQTTSPAVATQTAAKPSTTVANPQLAIAAIEKEIADTNANPEYTPERRAAYVNKLNSDIAKLRGAILTTGATTSTPTSTMPVSNVETLGKELDSLIASYNLLQSKGQVTPDIVESMKTKRADLLNRVGIARKQNPENTINQDELAKARAIILGR